MRRASGPVLMSRAGYIKNHGNRYLSIDARRNSAGISVSDAWPWLNSADINVFPMLG